MFHKHLCLGWYLLPTYTFNVLFFFYDKVTLASDKDNSNFLGNNYSMVERDRLAIVRLINTSDEFKTGILNGKPREKFWNDEHILDIPTNYQMEGQKIKKVSGSE